MRNSLRIRSSALAIGAVAFVAASFAGGWATPAGAQAQSTVVVLGIRSLEGDDDFTRNLTGALRHAASQIDGWTVSDREVTLAQMALAHGCADPDAACMGNIAGALEADLVIYGDVRRSSNETDFDFSLNLHLYNQGSREIAHSVAETIPGVRRDIDDLRDPARRYVAALSGAPRTGTLSVSTNVPGAEVFIDDESAGTTDGEGHLIVTDIPSGSRSIRVVAEGHQSFTSTATIEAYGEANFEAELQAGSSGDGGGGGGVNALTIIGAVSLGLAAVAAAVWIGGFIHIHGGIGADEGNTSTGDEDWGSARVIYGTYPPTHPMYQAGGDNTVPDICAEARGPNAALYEGRQLPPNVRGTSFVADLCDEYDTWLPIQIGAGITAAVLTGAGIGLLLAGVLSGDDGGSANISVAPSFSDNYQGVTVFGSF